MEILDTIDDHQFAIVAPDTEGGHFIIETVNTRSELVRRLLLWTSIASQEGWTPYLPARKNGTKGEILSEMIDVTNN